MGDMSTGIMGNVNTGIMGNMNTGTMDNMNTWIMGNIIWVHPDLLNIVAYDARDTFLLDEREDKSPSLGWLVALLVFACLAAVGGVLVALLYKKSEAEVSLTRLRIFTSKN